jgi:heterodisulfide reductase subunit A
MQNATWNLKIGGRSLGKKRVLVIGGGIAGITAALELAKNGQEVFLVEREPCIGGHAASFCCKATDICNKCSVCLVPERMREVGSHPQISLLTTSQVREINGEAGDFRVRIAQSPRFIDPDKCTACGICTEACPVEPPKAINSPYPGAVPPAFVFDKDRCLHFQGEECTICQDRCPTGAINFDQDSQEIDLDVGAAIVATGFEVFDAREKALLGYGKYPNVLTGLDMEERLLKDGTILLPSNGKPPQDVAFIQCVGSRDEHIGNGYCSKVCCKYAMRFSRLLQYQNPEAKITVFYMDVQTAGKGFGDFYKQCKENIRFVQGIPVEIYQVSSDQLELRYEDLSRGKINDENHDLVILSVGITPRKDNKNLARVLGLNLGDFGFFDTLTEIDNTSTNIEGIFVAGCCQGPKDIPESIAHSTQAALRVVRALT